MPAGKHKSTAATSTPTDATKDNKSSKATAEKIKKTITRVMENTDGTPVQSNTNDNSVPPTSDDTHADTASPGEPQGAPPSTGENPQHLGNGGSQLPTNGENPQHLDNGGSQQQPTETPHTGQADDDDDAATAPQAANAQPANQHGETATHKFLAPKWVTEHLNVPEGTEYEFLRPSMQQQGSNPLLRPTDAFAVRFNEKYHDPGAALQGERIYVRKAMLRAGSIDVFPINGKNPVMIIRDFQAGPITGNQPSLTLAKNRVQWHTPPTSGKRLKTQASKPNAKQYRITAPAETTNTLAAGATTDMHFATNEHHVPGMLVAHAYLSDDAVQVARDAGALIMDLNNIVTSENDACMITIRAEKKIDCNAVYNFATRLQNADPSLGIEGLEKSQATYRTYNCVRMTMPRAITPEFLRNLRKKLPPDTVALTDVPLNMWASSRNEAPRAPRPPRAPKPAKPRSDAPEGTRTYHFACDHVPHPEEFNILANALGGTLVEVANSRYTTRPMACKVAVDKDKDISEFLEEAGFEIEFGDGMSDGRWRGWPVGRNFV